MKKEDCRFFSTAADFRLWLEKNHQTETELIVGYYKVNSGKDSMSWSESVDQALCFGWIDGVRRSIDEDSYCIRFTPRRVNSIWSTVNLNKMNDLLKKDLVAPAGKAIFFKRKEDKTSIYSFEQNNVLLSEEFEKELRKHPKAWDYYCLLAPSYKKNSIHWVMSAKQEATRIKRLRLLITDCEAGRNRWKS